MMRLTKALCAAAFLGLIGCQKPPAAVPSSTTASAPDPIDELIVGQMKGRYQFHVVTARKGSVIYKCDTATGRTWFSLPEINEDYDIPTRWIELSAKEPSSSPTNETHGPWEDYAPAKK